MSIANTTETSSQVARFLAPETSTEQIVLFAQPYNIGARGFYFSNLEDYERKVETLRDDCGNRVEEFELQFIDGDDAQLFEACAINQANLSVWFDDIMDRPDHEKTVLYFLTSVIGYTLEQALDKLDEPSICEGRLESVAEDLFDEIYDIPEHLAAYIDYEKFARDCELNGDLNEFEFAGTTYTCTNAACL